jgi:hypothetical protein
VVWEHKVFSVTAYSDSLKTSLHFIDLIDDKAIDGAGRVRTV